jgi:hypothetical protein
LGLGTVIEIMPKIISADAVLKGLDIPEGWQFYANLCIGHRLPDSPIPPKDRKPLSEIAKFYE